MSYCFATCGSGLRNAAPDGDGDGDKVHVGSFGCKEDMEGMFAERSSQPMELPFKSGASIVSAKTIAILVKHGGNVGNVPREFKFGNEIVLNSEAWPKARAEFKECNPRFLGPIENVYSKTEFVLMVLRNGGEDSAMFRNGVKIASSECTTLAPQVYSLKLGENGFGGTIKSFAMWNRVLSDAEISSLDSTKLTC